MCALGLIRYKTLNTQQILANQEKNICIYGIYTVLFIQNRAVVYVVKEDFYFK